jgi:hypothetical protein
MIVDDVLYHMGNHIYMEMCNPGELEPNNT